MNNFLTAPANDLAGKGLTDVMLQSANAGILPSSFIRGSNSEPATTVPKAYINYIFFDEQFHYAGGNASRVGTSGTVKDHWQSDAALQNISVPKNGYLFVYVSNESNFNVFFDNLQVIHKPGAIVEETHYYPFGLTMGGISSKAAVTGVENRFKYNGKEEQRKEFANGNGLEWMDYGARMYDAQIGRWMVKDPLSESYYNFSPFQYTGNNPINFIDIDGNVIGNPDDPKVKKLQMLFERSSAGKDLWNRMKGSSRTIYLIAGRQHAEDIKEDNIGWYLAKKFSAAITISAFEYKKNILKTGEGGEGMLDIVFNEKTGMYDKTNDWDNTYILFDEEVIGIEAEVLAELTTQKNESAFDQMLFARIFEEGEHSVQNYIDGTVKIKGKNGLYIKPRQESKNLLPYNKRKNEIDAKKKAKTAIRTFIKENNINLDEASLKFIFDFIDGNDEK